MSRRRKKRCLLTLLEICYKWTSTPNIECLARDEEGIGLVAGAREVSRK